MDNIYYEQLLLMFEERRQRNSRYSARALARDLSIDPTDLINMMKGKKKVTPKIAYRIGLELNLKETALLEFIVPSLS